ncbi:hypothetical protein NFI96_031907 [Prochilodus magdalenae]|nr:hypothetical protein NFI96_031907 [Prochilodus magdalenae]
MEEAQKLLTTGHFNTSDPKLSVLLYESVQGPAWGGFAGCCDVCSAHLSQLKREAVRMLLSQDRTIWPSAFPASISPGRSASGAHTLPRACSSHSPTPSPRHRPCNPRTDDWIREQSTLWPLSSTSDGLSSFAEMMSQDDLKNNREDEKAASSGTVLCHFSSPLSFSASKVSTMLPAGTSAAVSFIVRAVQKLNLTSRRRKQNSYCSRYPTNFSSLLQKAPPPVPSNLLQTACKGREMTESGKVKVILRVSPLSMTVTSQLHTLKLDLRKKQVTVLEPATQSTQRLAAGTISTPKTFTFDATFGPESSQADVCEKSLFEVLQSVLAGADGCVLSFGPSKVGTSYTMIGRDDCSTNLGIIPCAISWLFKLINKKKDRTWANISVSVSAVEVCGETEVIRDLLSDVESGDCKDTHKPNVYLVEDPVCGIQLCNNSVLSAPTAERAAFLLDAALASRSSCMTSSRETFQHHCHMFYTLHVCQQHIESSSKSGMNVDQSKLSLIDLGSCTKERNKNSTSVCLVDLGNVIMTKLNRHKHVPNKGSKLAMLMQESLSNVNCRTSVVAHVSTLPEDISETLCTIQIVSQIRRLQRKAKNRLGCIDGSDVVAMFSCKEQTANTVTKSKPLSSKANKISTGQPEIQGTSNKNDCNEKGIRPHLQRDTPVKKIEAVPCRHTVQAKTTATKLLLSSPKCDIVSNSMQAEQATGSQSLTEAMDTTLPLPLPEEGKSSDDFTVPSETRIAPVGKSSSSSFSAGQGSPISLPVTTSEGIPQFPMENQRQMKATITVTVQQPLDLNGHDELIYSVVEEVTINGAVNKGEAAKITGITDPHSLESLPSGSQPVRIISSVGEETPAVNSASKVQALGKICESSSVVPADKPCPLVQNPVDSSQVDDSSHLVATSEMSQNIEKDVSEATCGSTSQYEALRFKEYSSGMDGDYASAQAKGVTSPSLRDVFDDDLTVSRTGRSFKRVPRFFPMYDAVGSDTNLLSKLSQPKLSAGSKLLSSPKGCKMSGTSPMKSCASPKSARHSINRSSSLSPDGLSMKHISWSTQSLSRKRGKASISSKSPSRVLNGRIELLRASGDSLSSSSQGSLDFDEHEVSKTKMTLLTHTLPSPYSRVTAPRKPTHCSGHASDNTSVLSGELPPAMCKTAFLYNRNSMVSSGYESMVRDSEATCSSNSIHDSISDQSCFFDTAKGARGSKKKNNIGSYQRRPSQDTLLSLRRSASGSKIRWVDRGVSDSYEIKVYEIDNVDGLQKRGKAGNKSVVCFSAKLKFLEHRQQRIAEVRAKYSALKRELELTKQHLMTDPGKWTREFDLWQTFEVDSLEHLEALELVTERLESQVGRCKAHVMMVTSFDATPKRRQKKRCRPPVEYTGFIGI